MNESLRDRLPIIRIAMNEALAQVAAKHGLKTFNIGRIKFDPNAGFFRCQVEGIDAAGMDPDANRYEQNYRFDGLPKLGMTFKHRTGVDKIIGKTRGGKILTERGGKKFVWPLETVKKLCK